MLDKNLIQQNFAKSVYTYDSNAYVQKQTATKLLDLIKGKKFESILEIGSYTGNLTKPAVERFEFESYLAVDIVNSFDFIKNLSPKIKFKQVDIEQFQSDEKFDLIIANASLQWCNDFRGTIKNLKSFLNKNGILAISIFGVKNLIEIKEVFNSGLNYPKEEVLKSIFSKNAKITDEIIKLQFNSSMDILKHLKDTGVNSVSKNSLTVAQIKRKLEILEKEYNNILTYNPVFIVDYI